MGLSGHDCVAVDLPGHGTRATERFTLAGALETIDRAVDGCASPPLLVGLSLGGYSALAYAADHQDKLAGVMVTSTTYAGIALFEGQTQDAAKAFAAVAILDCAGNTVTGATVTTSAGGTAKYDGAMGPSSAATSTGADGIAYVFNMTPGDATINVTVGGKPYRTHHIFTRAGVFTITLATP